MFDRPKKQRMIDQFADRLESLEKEEQFMASLRSRFPDASRINVLSIGCGDEPFELDALSSFCSAHALPFHYVGIDVNEDDIQQCNQNYGNREGVSFHVMDGMDYPSIQKLVEGDIHVIILRHPLLFEYNPATAPVAEFFKRIFTSTVPYLLAEGGNMIVSLYHPEERQSFLELMKFVTKFSPHELKESKKIHYDTECFTTLAMGDKYIKVYADRYFFVIADFKPNLAIQLEKKNGIFENNRHELEPIVAQLARVHEELYDMKNKDNHFAVLLNQVIQKTIEWRRSHPEASLTDGVNYMSVCLSDKIDLHFSAKAENLSQLSFNLLKCPPDIKNPENVTRYYGIANAITQTVMNGGDLPDCHQALLLFSKRPIIFSQHDQPGFNKKNLPPQREYTPGVGF